MKDEDLIKILDELLAKYRSLKDLGPVKQNEEMAKYLSKRPEFEDSGGGPGGAWAKFKDGGSIIFDNTQPEDATPPIVVSSPTTPPDTSEPPDVPKDSQQTAAQMSALFQSLMSDTSTSEQEKMKKFASMIQSLVASSIPGSDKTKKENAKKMSALFQSLMSDTPPSDEDMEKFASMIQSLQATSTPSSTPSTPSSTTPSTSSSTHYGVPSSRKVYLYTAFDKCSWFGNAIKCLKKNGWYEVYVLENAGVDELMILPRCAVFALNSHSGVDCEDTYGTVPGPFSVYTSTPCTLANIKKYKKLWRLGQITMFHRESWDILYHFAITAEFVKEYWKSSFVDNSFVYLDSCHTMSSLSADFREALFVDANVSVVAGWTRLNPFNIGDETAGYLFDRLVGANEFEGTYPVVVPKEENTEGQTKQRPFDWRALMDDMAVKGLGVAYMSRLLFDPGGNGDFGLLRPSIEYLEVDEKKDELTLHGLFGKRPIKGKKVTVDGQELKIDKWSDSGDEIVCTNLPKSGKGSEGAVVVTINGLKSNEVPLTGWHGTFTYSIYKPGTDPDSWIGRITYKAFLRGDVHKSRNKPGRPPKYRQTILGMVEDMDNRAEYTSRGEYDDGEKKYTWSGSGVIPPDGSGKGKVAICGWWGGAWYPHPKLFDLMYTAEGEAKVSIYDKKSGKTLRDLTWPINVVYLFNEIHRPDPFILDVLQTSVTWDPNYDIPGNIDHPLFALVQCGYDLTKEKGFSADLKWEDMPAQYPPTTETEG